jgi:hypothetical protein
MKRILSVTIMAMACGMAMAEGPARDAAYYTTSFDGGELQFAKAECPVPNIPSHSVSPEGARRVEKAVKRWRTCFNGWREKLQAALPPGKEIPEDVARSMSPADLEKAKARIASVYAAIIADAVAQDDKINAAIDPWMTASREYNKGLGLPRDTRDRMERDQAEHLAQRATLTGQ